MKKIFTILVLACVLASCKQNTEKIETPTNTGSSQVETQKVVETPKNAEFKIEQITYDNYKFLKPTISNDKVSFETEEFSLELPKNFNLTEVKKSTYKDEYVLAMYSLEFGNANGGIAIEKISEEKAKFPLDGKIIKNAKWENFHIYGNLATEKETDNIFKEIEKNIKFHTTPKAESEIAWKSETYTVKAIKPQIIGEKVILKTQEFELNLPQEMKDFYLEILESGSYFLKKDEFSGYFLIIKTDKEHIEHARNCDKKYPQPRENLENVSEDCIKVMFDENHILGTLDNGDVIEYKHSLDAPKKEIQAYDEILKKYTKNPAKDENDIVSAYLKENIIITQK